MMIRFSGSSRASFKGRTPILKVRPGHGPARRPCLAMVVEDRRQVARGDPRAVAEGDRSLNGGLELADVARPVVLLQDVERIPGESRDGFVEFAGVVGPERFGQELDIGPPVPKRGSMRLITLIR